MPGRPGSSVPRTSARRYRLAIVEASDAVGGRVRSDHVDGYMLDRGFQILLDELPR